MPHWNRGIIILELWYYLQVEIVQIIFFIKHILVPGNIRTRYFEMHYYHTVTYRLLVERGWLKFYRQIPPTYVNMLNKCLRRWVTTFEGRDIARVMYYLDHKMSFKIVISTRHAWLINGHTPFSNTTIIFQYHVQKLF